MHYYAKPEAQAYVREQAIRLHHEGWTNVDIAKHFNVHPNIVGKWPLDVILTFATPSTFHGVA
ncbi:helix-turn-helix domain-containing protein, partial [uncultured Sutterella sp.]|uniref:helix-turn-helix domain-containing protein n=1 Tax=uncultured Sutterella sp. TaxID=286133 RepID=UPI0034A05F67